MNKWSTSFRAIKVVVSEDFSETSFQRGVQSFCRFVVFWSKNRFKIAKFGFAFFCSGGCCFMLLLDNKKGAWQKQIKQGFFATPVLERRKREKRRERPEVKNNTPFFHQIFWGLKKGQEVVPPFWAPKFQFFKSAKTILL